ncbi:hypothetical protein L204_106146 [Cryptococcus depauperatus]|nr:hypothetical protein L204_05705 [Cryptococcus depauperatus CBS 7855]
MATATPVRSPRYHPYLLNPSHPAISSSHNESKHRKPHLASNGEYPPSPPRSRRDPSETPSISLSMAFGANGGAKWWDEELPPPPASLSNILDSFRKSGEGDRELLLSILGAKKAEEERLSAMIHTRLTILQARLSLHQAAAFTMPAVPTAAMPDLPPIRDPNQERSPERMPSLTSHHSGRSSSGIASPSDAEYMPPPPRPVAGGYEKEREREEIRLRYWQRPTVNPAVPCRHEDLAFYRDIRDTREGCEQTSRGRSDSPKEAAVATGRDRSGSGLEMLLDVGMRGLEKDKRK